MLYSGVDLIRSSGQAVKRAEKLVAVKPVDAKASNLDDQTNEALLRFARFINKEGARKKPKIPRKRSTQPYLNQKARQELADSRGQLLDIRV